MRSLVNHVLFLFVFFSGHEPEVEGTLSVQPQANPVKGFQEYFLNLTVENNKRNPWFGGKVSFADLGIMAQSTVKMIFCDPVVLELICLRTRANRLLKESNTTGGLKKLRRASANEKRLGKC